MKITFLGAGVFGTALAKVAEENGHEIRFYDPFKFPDITLKDATNGSDLNIYTAPSNAAKDILENLDKETPLICASKGFLSLKPFENFKDFSALGGAGFAEQIENAEQTESSTSTITFTTSSEAAETIFSTENIKIEFTKDTLGIMLCGALKNVFALGAGLYGESDSTAAPMSYLESAVSEMQQILKANHADPETLRLSCGAADLVLSCTEKGRNFRFGRDIKNGKTNTKETVESLSIINSLETCPDFVIPESAHLFNDIINTIKDQNVTK